MPKAISHEAEQELFKQALIEIINESPASHLLSIPGIWEVLSEHYNNDVLAKIEADAELDE